MRKKGLRVLSLVLTASLVLSSVNTGASVLAAGLDNRVMEQSVSGEASTEETGKQPEEDSKQASETESTEKPGTETTTEQIAEADTTSGQAAAQEEKTEEILPSENTTEQGTEEQKELIEEKTKPKQASTGTLVRNLIPDASLRAAIISIYNEETGTNVNDANFTYGQLSTYTGALNFTSANVRDVTGLGSAKKASSIDISSFTQVTSIPAGEFEGCEFTTFAFPSTINNIGSKAFYECTKLTEITLPDTLSVLGKQAFASCSSLSGVHSTAANNTLPSGLTLLQEQAFLDAVSLKQISIPSFADGRILQDEPSIFSGCKSLEKVVIGQSITTLPASIFTNAGTDSANGMAIEIATGSKLDKILGGAFSGAKLQATVDLSACKSLTTIEGSAFEAASGLKTVILPVKSSGTLSLGSRVFAKTELTTMNEAGKTTTGQIVLPDYVSEIGDGCFYGNKKMTHISLAPNLPAIPDYTFDGCTALVNIEQRQKSGSCQIKEIGDCAFRSTAIENTDFLLKMNRLETIGYQRLDQVSKYGIGKNKTDEEKVLSIGEGGVTDGMSILDKETNQKWNSSKKLYYGSEVFTNCLALTDVKLPASVKNIGGRAFYFVGYDAARKSNIKKVTWASSTDGNVQRNIYAEAFHGNSSMTTMLLPENKNAGESLNIGAYAFYGATKMNRVGVSSEGKNVLPASLKKLGEGAFYYCAALENITVQTTEDGKCPELGIKAFEKCLTLKTATIPKEATEIPRHFFYDVPLTAFYVGDNSSISITKIGALAFFGNAFTTLDLSKYTALKEIDGGAFAAVDNLKEKEEPNKTPVVVPESTGGEKLTTVILPGSMDHDVILNSAAFYAQIIFNTMKIPGGQDGQVYIPDYLVELDSQGLFACTSVKKVVWQADTTGKNQWKKIPVNMYYGCDEIKKAEDVLPKGNYVEAIGKAAFKFSSVESADLSAYTSLKTIGWGTMVGSGTAENGVFQDCAYLGSVKLPQTAAGVKLSVGTKTFYNAVNLRNVDLGGAWELQNDAFNDCQSLTAITFPAALEKLGTNVFKDCNQLETVEFGSLKEIGNNSFENCVSLVLTEKGLPDSLQKIGARAFYKAAALGEVSFGPGLTKIDNNAFLQSGVTKFDFKRAVNLETIASKAFSEIATLNTFKLENTKVKQIEDILFGCQALTSASFGNEVLYIKKDALGGCKSLTTFSFASTTTVSNDVFYTPYKSEYTANAGNITINVVTPEKTVIPTGRTVTLPYYINEKTFSKFDYILAGNLDSTEAVKEHLQVSAKLNDGYYWKRQSNEDGDIYKVTEAAYFNPLAETAFIKRPEISRDIDVIQVKGLKATQGTIDFSIACSLSFRCQSRGNETMSVTATKFSAKYKIEVKDVPYYADIYADNNRTVSVPHGRTENVQIMNSKKYLQYFFNIENAEPVDCPPETYDVVIETDNQDVVYPSASSGGTKQASYTTTRGTNINTTTNIMTPNKSGQTFYLVQAGVGTANIRIYPKGHPEYARTYKYVVNSDIQSLALAVPKEYNSGAAPGAVFHVFSNYKNYFGQTATAADMSNYSRYSNQKIIYTSDAPDYVSVDALGTVKILKADANAKRVKITATAPTSVAGRVVSANVTITVKYPDTKVNEKVVDQATGSTVAVTKVSKKDLEGEVKFVKPAATSSSVTIPDTITVNGVKYKVTTIAANAFKNNSKIKTVKLGKYVKQIESNAFYGCKVLNKITLPASIEKIGSKAFYNCKKLKTVSISSKAKLTEIGSSAFQNCYSLTKITIPAKVTKIGSKAFYNCKKLKTITIKSTVLRSVGKSAFKNIYKKATIKVPKKKLAAYKTLLKGKGQKSSVKIKK